MESLLFEDLKLSREMKHAKETWMRSNPNTITLYPINLEVKDFWTGTDRTGKKQRHLEYPF